MPGVLRNCSHCGCRSHFVCSGKFRVNAQQKKLDVWLIYRCENCDRTWNMEIFSRVSPGSIPIKLYQGFLENDRALAFRYAFDAQILAKNEAAPCFDGLLYEIEGEEPDPRVFWKAPVTLRIEVPYRLPLRLDKFLSEKLSVPRSRIREYCERGAIRYDGSADMPDVCKLRLKEDITLQIDLKMLRAEGEEYCEKA